MKLVKFKTIVTGFILTLFVWHYKKKHKKVSIITMENLWRATSGWDLSSQNFCSEVDPYQTIIQTSVTEQMLPRKAHCFWRAVSSGFWPSPSSNEVSRQRAAWTEPLNRNRNEVHAKGTEEVSDPKKDPMGKTQEGAKGEHRSLKGFHTAVARTKTRSEASAGGTCQQESKTLRTTSRSFRTYPTRQGRRPRVLSRGCYAVRVTD